jgi:hypothetical protein
MYPSAVVRSLAKLALFCSDVNVAMPSSVDAPVLASRLIPATELSAIAQAQPNKQIANASLAQIQPAIVAAEAAYNSLLAAQQSG